MSDSSRAADTVSPTGNELIDGLLTSTKWKQDADGETTTLTFSFPSSSSQYDGYVGGEEPFNGFLQLTQFQQDYFRGLLDNLETVTNLRFEELSGARSIDATVRVGWTEDNDDGVVAWAYLPEDNPWAGDVWLNAKSFSPTSTTVSDYEVGVLMHEFGHALGLAHPHEEEEGGFGILPEQWDGPEYTSMTYNISADFKSARESDLYPQTYMWLDIQALQHLYGKNMTATAGNETYDYDLSERHYLTIWDAGGNDTLSVSNGNKDVELNLTPGTWSDVGTVVTFTGGGDEETREKTVFITPDTIIENATGADGNDKITGNDVANVLKGNGGDDTLMGGAGADRLVGGSGSDVVDGGSGNDAIWAGAGDSGDDKITGGAGNDIAGGGAGDDLVVGDGTGSNDTAGNDTLFGGAGADTLLGGSWQDEDEDGKYDAGEAKATTGADVDLLWGGAGDDVIDASGGNDRLGGGSGDDTLMGGDGHDTLYGGKTGAESADDELFGGNGDDLIFGGEGTDSVDGGDGADTLYGGSGEDTISGGGGNDWIYGGAGDDMLSGGSGEDVFFFKSGHGDDVVNDFDVAADELILTDTVTDFTSVADVAAASSETTVDGVSGLLINTGGGDSIFLGGITHADLSQMDIEL